MYFLYYPMGQHEESFHGVSSFFRYDDNTGVPGGDAMQVVVLGAGMMGRAIAYDCAVHLPQSSIILVDQSKDTLVDAQRFLQKDNVSYTHLSVHESGKLRSLFSQSDLALSAVPYMFNLMLSKLAIKTETHFLDLGGNNTVVAKQKKLSKQAEHKNILIVPDCGLAPGLTSVLTKDLVEHTDHIQRLAIRVGGLPQKPIPPLEYQLVFSPYGLINEYAEDALVLENGQILTKPSMTNLEALQFPDPYGTLEAFLTSGGCSTLPYTYKDHIDSLDYKTIRYPGHCAKIKTLIDLGFASIQPVQIQDNTFVPRDLLAQLLSRNLPHNQPDVVLVRLTAQATTKNQKQEVIYQIIDTYDHTHRHTAMMRMTAFPVAITAQLVLQKTITATGVLTSEEIIPCAHFFAELSKRNITIEKRYNPVEAA